MAKKSFELDDTDQRYIKDALKSQLTGIAMKTAKTDNPLLSETYKRVEKELRAVQEKFA